jgi:hypothetical protein
MGIVSESNMAWGLVDGGFVCVVAKTPSSEASLKFGNRAAVECPYDNDGQLGVVEDSICTS